jgi:transmembrane sensor
MTPPGEEVPEDKERDAVDAAAQDWFLRLSSGDATRADAAAFAAWRNADTRHARAYEEVRAAWHDAGALQYAFVHGEVSPAMPERAAPVRRRVVLASALAAGLALFALSTMDLRALLTADHSTAVGEQTTITLPDGTRAHLNTDTAISVAYTEGRRRVSLLRGEVLFEVKRDAARPFDVLAQAGLSNAVGTAFAVRDEDDGATVTVTEGVVRVESPADTETHAVMGSQTRKAMSGVSLRAGEQVRYRRGNAPGAVARLDADAAKAVTAWRRGNLVIRGLPFANAVAEIDRYRPGKILLLADTARLQPVTARLSLSSLDAGLEALAATHGLAVTYVTGYLAILR